MHQKLSIPDSWETLEDFAHWFQDNGYPMRVPADMQIYTTDYTHSCIVFRHGVYQAELYFIKQDKPPHPHSHEFESITIFISGGISGISQDRGDWAEIQSEAHKGPHSQYGLITKKTLPGRWHDFKTSANGSMLFVLQKWDNSSNMTSATINYTGVKMGMLHETMLNSRIT